MSVQRIVPCMTCHAWNGDHTKVAICPNTKDVLIYKKTGTGYELEATLKEVSETQLSFLLLSPA